MLLPDCGKFSRRLTKKNEFKQIINNYIKRYARFFIFLALQLAVKSSHSRPSATIEAANSISHFVITLFFRRLLDLQCPWFLCALPEKTFQEKHPKVKGKAKGSFELNAVLYEA